MFPTFHTCSTCPFINNKVAVANDDNKKSRQRYFWYENDSIRLESNFIICIVVTMLKHIEIYPHA